MWNFFDGFPNEVTGQDNSTAWWVRGGGEAPGGSTVGASLERPTPIITSPCTHHSYCSHTTPHSYWRQGGNHRVIAEKDQLWECLQRPHRHYHRVLVCCGHVAGVLSPVLCDVSAWGNCVRSVVSTVTVWVLGNYTLSPAHLCHTCNQGLTIFEMESTILFSLFFAEKILLWLSHFHISIDHIC